jgi:benzodiazapine receptor
MNAINTMSQYAAYIKPVWAPPSWLFGPVWTILYIIIAITFGYVFWQYAKGRIGLKTVTPFALNLVFNLLYTPIMFKLGDMILATLDILLVLATLIWIMVVAWKKRWIAYANMPYLAWVIFATILQLSILYLNSPCSAGPSSFATS